LHLVENSEPEESERQHFIAAIDVWTAQLPMEHFFCAFVFKEKNVIKKRKLQRCSDVLYAHRSAASLAYCSSSRDFVREVAKHIASSDRLLKAASQRSRPFRQSLVILVFRKGLSYSNCIEKSRRNFGNVKV
jgi:hypothetical protein